MFHFHKKVIDKKLSPTETCDLAEYYPRIVPNLKKSKIDMMFNNIIYNCTLRLKKFKLFLVV